MILYFTGNPTPARSKKSSFSSESANNVPKEVFIVDIKKGPSGLRLGLVDGLVSSIDAKGIYVRSLLPDDPTSTVRIEVK